MKQAIHIFLKDLRGLWIQIAILMLLIGLFAATDITGADAGGFSSVSVIVVAAVWFLIGRTIHQESLVGENQFWLTRPYERRSLLASKILMAACMTVIPFFIADCVILVAQSLPIAANFGGLVLRQFVVAAWLVLPPFAVATVTRSLTEDIIIWMAGVAIAIAGYFPGSTVPDFRSAKQIYLVVAALVLMLLVIWWQYSRRGTTLGRLLMAAAVLLPVLPFPESVALAFEGVRNDSATSGISLVAKSDHADEGFSGTVHLKRCVSLPVSVSGMQPGWRLVIQAQKDTFNNGNKTSTSDWVPSGPFTRFENGSDTISECLTEAALRELGTGPLSVHTSIALAVVKDDPPIGVKSSSPRAFGIPGVGTCQFHFLPMALQFNYALSCKTAVWFPHPGKVDVKSTYSADIGNSGSPYPWMPMNLLPGLGPVYAWVPIRSEVGYPAEVEFRPVTQIAVLRRDLDVKEARFNAQQ